MTKYKFLSLISFLFITPMVNADTYTDKLGISDKFPGIYKLKSASGGAAPYYCAKIVEVDAYPDGIGIGDITTTETHAGLLAQYFPTDHTGCAKDHSDIGLLRVECHKFQRKEVYISYTDSVTIAGVMTRQYIGMSLGTFDSNKLSYRRHTSDIPFGVFGIWDDQNLDCDYERISNSPKKIVCLGHFDDENGNSVECGVNYCGGLTLKNRTTGEYVSCQR